MTLSLRKYRPHPPPRHGTCDRFRFSHNKSRRLCKPTLHVPLSVQYDDRSVQLMRWSHQGVVVVACPRRRRHTHTRARTHARRHTHTRARTHAHTHTHTHTHADTRADAMGSEWPSCCWRQRNTAGRAAERLSLCKHYQRHSPGHPVHTDGKTWQYRLATDPEWSVRSEKQSVIIAYPCVSS